MARVYAFRKTGSTPPAARRKSSAVSGARRLSLPARETERCSTKGYTPRWEKGPPPGGTNTMRNLSPSLRGCYADPIEVALEEHGDMLPAVITDPGSFTTEHHYVNPRDPGAYPKHCAVTTVCRRSRLRTFVHRPGESLAVFGDS